MKVNAQIKKTTQPHKQFGTPMNAPARTGSWASALYWLATGVIALGVGYGIATQTWLVITILTIILMMLIVHKKMLWGITIILFLPVVGELYRLPFGGDNGTLLSDVAIGVVVAIWLFQKIQERKKFPENDFNKPLFAFCGVAIFSLILSLTFLQFNEVATGSLYLVRFLEYTLLGIVTLNIAKTEKDRMHLLKTMICSAALIAAAGFIQLLVYPDLVKLQEYGWDPHQNRLVSTWLDPNFIGGLLSYIIAILTGIALYSKKFLKKTGLILLIAVLAVALFLTYSRSGYLAGVAALLIIGIFKSRKLLVGSIIIFMIALSLLPRAQQRVDDLVTSAESFLMNTSQTADATAKLRIISWNQTLQLIEQRPFFGSGYNTLKYVKYNEGFVSDTDIHSASGSDSSMLTILATTGIFGLIPFIILYWNILKLSFQNWRNKKIPETWQGYGLGIFAGTCGLLVHSLFVNSLLFPQILIFFWVSVGLLTGPVANSRKHQADR